MESLKMKIVLPVSADKLYKAWLSSKEHTAFTGGAAKINDNVNGKHSAWDGYISGKNVELLLNKKIVQTWRTSEFSDSDEDSILELEFEEKAGKTTLHLFHHNLPEGGSKKYGDGWKDHYFEPMKNYFKK